MAIILEKAKATSLRMTDGLFTCARHRTYNSASDEDNIERKLYVRRIVVVFLCVFVLAVGLTLAQSTPATPAVPQPTPSTTPLATALPADDARLAVCSAPTLAGFVPYIVRPGDRLADLMAGVENVTITQVAALNCLDDPAALPVGATIWLPENLTGIEVAFPIEDTNPNVDHVIITSVRQDAEVVPNQAGITITWAAEGSEAYLYPCPADPEADCSRPFNARQVPLAHSVTLRDFQYAGNMRYRLEVVDGDQVETRDISFRVVCSQVSLAPTSGFELCADAPASPVFAAWQPFEGGVMIWFSDTRQIYAMFNDGHRVQVFADPYTTSAPEPTVEPPRRRFAPVRGFGLVWRELGAQGSDLGWALAEEIGFDSARQAAGSQSYTTYIQGPGATIYAVTVIPGTDGGYWMQTAG